MEKRWKGIKIFRCLHKLYQRRTLHKCCGPAQT